MSYQFGSFDRCSLCNKELHLSHFHYHSVNGIRKKTCYLCGGKMHETIKKIMKSSKQSNQNKQKCKLRQKCHEIVKLAIDKHQGKPG